jgi:hypothetical protein
MIGAYQSTEHFAYPGWRLTVPGGPAGGHYKGFTHTQAAGTDIPPGDPYEQDREDGMSSHDAVHASPRNPRGVYRSSAEVPPRPNASGAAMTYRGFQTQRHAGTSVAPGSFPAPVEETDEDAFLARYGEHAAALAGLGLQSDLVRGGIFTDGGPVWPGPMPVWPGPPQRPNTARLLPIQAPPIPVPCEYAAPPEGCHYVGSGTASDPCAADLVCLPETGATNVVRQTPPTPAPLPPSPSVPVVTAPPISPRPSPTVATNEVIPMNDGSGNWVNVSTGQVIPGSAVAQNPATGQVTAPAGALSWLEQNTIFSALPNWGVLAAGLLAASMFLGKHR